MDKKEVEAIDAGTHDKGDHVDEQRVEQSSHPVVSSFRLTPKSKLT